MKTIGEGCEGMTAFGDALVFSSSSFIDLTGVGIGMWHQDALPGINNKSVPQPKRWMELKFSGCSTTTEFPCVQEACFNMYLRLISWY